MNCSTINKKIKWIKSEQYVFRRFCYVRLVTLKNKISLKPDLSILFICPNYHFRITYSSYKFWYKSHVTSPYSPDKVFGPAILRYIVLTGLGLIHSHRILMFSVEAN
jgi:hypothetical protein